MKITKKQLKNIIREVIEESNSHEPIKLRYTVRIKDGYMLDYVNALKFPFKGFKTPKDFLESLFDEFDECREINTNIREKIGRGSRGKYLPDHDDKASLAGEKCFYDKFEELLNDSDYFLDIEDEDNIKYLKNPEDWEIVKDAIEELDFELDSQPISDDFVRNVAAYTTGEPHWEEPDYNPYDDPKYEWDADAWDDDDYDDDDY